MSIVSVQDGNKMLFILEDPVAVQYYMEPPDLPHVKKPIVVTQLRYSHVPKAAQTWQDAFANDPLHRYARETPDYKGGSTIGKPIEKAIQRLLIALWIRSKITKTVDKGAAIIIATYAENSPEGRKRNPFDRLIVFLTKSLFRGLRNAGTLKQRERGKEITTKTEAVVEKAIGDRTKDMFYVDGLATAPAEQGHGYGGAVLDSVTKEADVQHRGTWLVSSNIINTDFYNSHGFVTVGTFLLGDKNPEWHEPSVVVNIMVREPTKCTAVNEKDLA